MTILNAKNINMSMDNFQKIYFYNNGAIIGETRYLREHTIKDNKISEVYDGVPENIYCNFEIKKAVKLNLNRKDAFYYKNTEARYNFDKKYNLYINTDLVKFGDLGDIIRFKSDDETNYLHAYKVTFSQCDFNRGKVERVLCDKYELQNNEKFVYSMSYGPDKMNAHIEYFNNSKNEYIKKRHPERRNDHGVLKRYHEIETKYNCELIITKPYYSKTEYSEKRTNINNLCDELKNAGFEYSHFDIERLQKAGFDIIKIK